MPKELIIPLNDHISIHACVEPNPDESWQLPDEIAITLENTVTGDVQDIAVINPAFDRSDPSVQPAVSRTQVECRVFADPETPDVTDSFLIESCL